jgi:creatinine amidohydrolase
MAARELRLRHGDFVVVPHGVSRLPNASSKQISEQEKRLSMHAGHSETALMLALAPDTVHMERAAANFPPPFPDQAAVGRRPPGLRMDRARLRPERRDRRPDQRHARTGHRDPGHAVRQLGAGADRAAPLRWVVREEPTWERGHQQGHIQQSFVPA